MAKKNVKKNNKGSKCYIINNVTNKRLNFQYAPTSIPYSRGANYNSIESPGMNYPLTQYVGGQVREFSFELFYYDKPYSGAIDSARNFLEALLPPEFNSMTYNKPPSFTLAYGYFVRKLVLLDLAINDEWLDGNGNPIMTRFTLTVRQVGR